MFLIFLAVIIVIVWAYVLFIRDWLDKTYPTQYGWWYTLENNLWASSKTILTARLYWVGGIVVALHDLAANAGFDWTPITTEIGNFIPGKYRPLVLAVGLAVTGILFEYLRRITTKPVGEGDN